MDARSTQAELYERLCDAQKGALQGKGLHRGLPGRVPIRRPLRALPVREKGKAPPEAPLEAGPTVLGRLAALAASP